MTPSNPLGQTVILMVYDASYQVEILTNIQSKQKLNKPWHDLTAYFLVIAKAIGSCADMGEVELLTALILLTLEQYDL